MKYKLEKMANTTKHISRVHNILKTNGEGQQCEINYVGKKRVKNKQLIFFILSYVLSDWGPNKFVVCMTIL